MSSRPMHFPVHTVVLGLAVVAALVATGPGAGPDLALAAVRTYTVNTTADTPDADVGTAKCADRAGHCSLRAAIMQANFHAGPDVIVIPSGTFKLTRKGDEDGAILGDLDITDGLTLKGAGSTRTIIDGNGGVTGDRVIQVVNTAGNVTISRLTIRNGKRTGTFDEGGGLLWSGGAVGTFALSDVVVEKNTAPYGAGVFLAYGTLGNSVDLNHVVIRSNTASSAAGGLGVVLDATATSFVLRNSHVYGNTAFQGGGVYLQGDVPPTKVQIAIASTEINANHAQLDGGIEIHAGTTADPFTMDNDYIHGNSAGVYGGGVGSYRYLVVTASTVSSNIAAQRGGGVYAYAGSTTYLIDATVSSNTTAGSGGGVYEEKFIASIAAVVARYSTFGGNTAALGGAFYLDAGTTAVLTNTLIAKGVSGASCSQALGGTSNLSDDMSCGFGGGDGVALDLSALGLHGGRTPTQVPLSGSAAVDAGSAGGAPATDQRGLSRPQGSAVDVGAVEVCQSKPAAPALLKPANRISTSHRHINLDWSTVPCVQGYNVVIRRGSPTGIVVQSITGLQASALVTINLRRGHTYYWRVTAVGDRGSTTSAWRRFHVKLS